ncbi:unnamed protein product [Phytophthora lilii]|uniref:Unnamed protein product n=1 Tax=Phytophthora lilii TaxID=2077276 RepID=A0A9W6X5L8_9STRA|nr:unnamed protein product [Phytophthora lilii]
MQATTQHRILSTDGVQDAPRRALPRPDTLQMSMPLRDTRERVQRERRSLTTMEERLQQFRDAGVERHRVSSYDGVIYSSQAVRDTMAAIEALKRGRFNQTVIAQAEESMDAIVQVWLRELNKAGKPRANW